MIGKGEKKHYVLIKDFNIFVYGHTLHRPRNNFFRYCLEAFRIAESLKCHIKDCFDINDKQRINMPAKGEYARFKNYKTNIVTIYVYADFECFLVSKDNGKQNPNESYTNKYNKNVANSYVCKLVYVDDKFSKPFKSF